MNYYISDYHFCHELARKRSRSAFFSSVEKMDNALIENHNKKVSQNDNVYILGDVIVINDDDNLENYMEQTIGKLNGNLHLILGNHDYKYQENPVFRKYFSSIQDSLIIEDKIEDKNKKIHLFHYPILQWYRKNKKAYHVYGHVHDQENSKEIKIIRKEEYALNACVEVNNFEPCTLEELIENNKKLR